MPKLIFGLVGQIACGKDISKKYLEEKYGTSSHRFSTMLRDILNRLYLPVSRSNLQDLSFNIRNLFGEDTLARVIAEDVKNDRQEIVVVEGIRRMADIVTLKNFPNFHLIRIVADPKIRYERTVKRNENIGDAEKTLEQFLSDEQRETEREIPIVMAKAKYQIDNNGSLTELYQQIDLIMTKLNK